jgi:hypothetical protein
MLPADRPDHEVGWPRAVQTGIAILGSVAFGAVALSYGYGFGGGGRSESYPQRTATPSYVFGGGANEPVGALTFFSYAPSQYGDSMHRARGGYNGGFNNGDGTGTATNTYGFFLSRSDTATIDGVVTLVSVLKDTAVAYPAGLASWSNWVGDSISSALYPDFAARFADTMPALDTLYTRFTVRIDGDFNTNPGNAKFFGIENQGTSGLAEYMVHRADSVAPIWRCQWSQNSGADCGKLWKDAAVTPYWPRRDSLYDVEILRITATSPGAGDDSWKMWIDGTEIANWTPIGGASDTIASGENVTFCAATASACGISGLNVWPYYDGGAFAAHGQIDTLYFSGLYMSGN